MLLGVRWLAALQTRTTMRTRPKSVKRLKTEIAAPGAVCCSQRIQPRSIPGVLKSATDHVSCPYG
jgi:hypothetical protein